MLDNNVVECKSGWKSLYQPIIDTIVKYDNEQKSVDKKIGFCSIVNHLGAMKVNLINPQNKTNDIAMLITQNEVESLHTCEFCGTKQYIGTTLDVTVKTCCEQCWKENILPRNQYSIWNEK